MMGSSTMPTPVLLNNTEAIGMPEASDFFEPQNTNTISSSREKPSARLPKVVSISTPPSNTALTSTNSASCCGGNRCHTPCATAALNAAYTANRMLPRSTTVSMPRCDSTHLPIHGRNTLPNTNGSSNCNKMLSTSCQPPPACCRCNSSATSNGVMTIPSKLEAVAP